MKINMRTSGAPLVALLLGFLAPAMTLADLPREIARRVSPSFEEFCRAIAAAMFNLGVMYFRGRGVTQDDAESYVWLSLAAAFGDETAREARDIVAERLTAETRLAAQKRAAQCYKTLAKPVEK